MRKKNTLSILIIVFWLGCTKCKAGNI